MQLVWDTTRLGEQEQFAYWRDVVWEAFVPVSLKRHDDGPFVSSVAARSIGPIGLSRICSEAQSVSRTVGDIGRGPGEVFFVNLPLSEGTSASQHGRAARLRAGDFTIVDSEHPFQLEFTNRFDQISLAVPKEVLSPMLDSPRAATALRIRGDRGLGSVAGAAIRDVAAKPADLCRRDGRALADHLLALICLALRGLRGRQTAHTGLLLQAAVDEVDASLGDPGLNPTSVAARLAISVRYLHKLFADEGTTFGRWVLHRRLESARDNLERSHEDPPSITQVAVRNGFGDPAYFTRTFKKAYQVTPSEYRLVVRRAVRAR